jgi:hypothetical protein
MPRKKNKRTLMRNRKRKRRSRSKQRGGGEGSQLAGLAGTLGVPQSADIYSEEESSDSPLNLESSRKEQFNQLREKYKEKDINYIINDQLTAMNLKRPENTDNEIFEDAKESTKKAKALLDVKGKVYDQELDDAIRDAVIKWMVAIQNSNHPILAKEGKITESEEDVEGWSVPITGGG